jgi:hypothetical protein
LLFFRGDECCDDGGKVCCVLGGFSFHKLRDRNGKRSARNLRDEMNTQGGYIIYNIPQCSYLMVTMRMVDKHDRAHLSSFY